MRLTISLFLFIASLAVFSFQAGFVGMEFKGDEGFYFQSGRQMAETDDWITPYYFDKPRFEKPILYYWIVAALFKVFGIGWKIARFPAAASMSFIVALTYLFGARLFNKSAALFSSIIVMASFTVFRYAKVILPEALFILLLSSALYVFIFKKGIIWAYILMGLAFLIKGPVAVILPLFILAAYRVSLGERPFKDIKFFPYIIITLLIGVPWFLVMIKIHGQAYIHHIFFRETIQRIGGLKPEKIIYYIPVMFLFYLPWSVLILHSLMKAVSSIREKDTFRNGSLLAFVWFFAVLIFFSFIGEKHRHYMLTLAIPFGLMTGTLFYSFSLVRKNRAIILFLFLVLFSFGFEWGKLAVSKRIGGIGEIFRDRAYNIEKKDILGIGSSSIVQQEVEVHANHPAERYWYKWPEEMKEECDRENKVALNKTLFEANPDRAYLIIKKRDFERYILPDTKKGLTILAQGYMYNKDAKPSGVFKALKSLEPKTMLDQFREEVLFVTNKRSAK